MEIADRRLARWLPATPYAAAAVLVVLKVPFYLSAQPLTGWDTIGHLHLATVYRELFSHLRSVGYDTGWFQGQPAFVLYPPFFYFVVALLDTLLGHWLPLTASFDVAILLVVLFYCGAAIRLAGELLRGVDPLERALLQVAAILVPLGYSGDGLQGAGLVGVIEGTFVSTLGLALALAALASFERYRRERRLGALVGGLACAGLLYYTHYLSTVFFCILLAIYIVSFRADLRGRLILALALVPPALGAPMIYLFLINGAYSSASAQLTVYPVLLSLLGKDFFAAWRASASLQTLVEQLLVRLQIAQVLTVALGGAGVWLVIRGRLRSPEARFVAAALLVFFWLALDGSPALLLPGLPVHWYRAFDTFLTLLSLMAVMAVSPLARRLGLRPWTAAAALAVLLALRFVSWDPVAHEEQPTMSMAESLRGDPDATRLASYLGTLPRGSVVLPEVLRSRSPHGSPHWLDFLIQSASLRNALGLTIESSLTPLVTYAYLSQGLGQVFVWGIDASWAESLFGGLGPAGPERLAILPDYLAAAGIGYVVTQSEAARGFAEAVPQRLQRTFASGGLAVYRVAGALPVVTALERGSRPWGLVDLEVLRGQKVPARRINTDFLFQANWVRLNAGLDPIINLSRSPGAIETLRERLAGLVVVNGRSEPATYHSLPSAARSGLPLVLVNFVPDPSLPPRVEVLPPAPRRGLAVAALPRRLTAPAARPRRIAPSRLSMNGSSVRASLDQPAGVGADMTEMTGADAFEVRLTYSPWWRSADGSPVFQTTLDHMLVFTASAPASPAPPARPRAPEAHLELAMPLARVVTLAMGLLALASVASFLADRTSWGRAWSQRALARAPRL